MIIDNLEELLVIEKRIDTRDTEDIRDRWESGKVLLLERTKPAGRGRPGIPKDRMAALIAAIGKEKSELNYRMQFAEQYPTEENFSSVLEKFTTWRQVCDNLPKPKREPAQRKKKEGIPASPISRDPKHEEIVARAKNGEGRATIAKDLGVTNRTVRRELEVEATIEQAAPIDISSLSDTAAVRLEAAKRSTIKRLEKEYAIKLLAEVDQIKAQLKDDVKAYKAKLDAEAEKERESRDAEREQYRTAVEAYKAKGLIPVSDYRLLIRCFHTDSHGDKCLFPKDDLNAAVAIITDPKVKALLIKEDKKK